MRWINTIFWNAGRHGAVILCASLSCANAAAQTETAPGFKNAVKLNLSAPLLYNSPIVVSYERLLRKSQSLTVYGGYMQFPSLAGLGASNIDFRKNVSNNGWTAGVEYRFYLPRENKHPAPHGVYIGPYLNYYRFHNERNARMNDGSDTESLFRSRIQVFNAGAQLGYQFVLAKRIVLDLILFAPSFASYDVRFSLDGNIDPDEKRARYNEVLERMKDRFPLMNKLADGATIDVQGRSTVWAPGFRYTVSAGYLFGKK